MLEDVIPEFRGTGEESKLLRPLLIALKQERFYDRWLDVYLEALHQYPTQGLVRDFAEDAVAVSQAVGREEELTIGFRRLSDIPLDSFTKARIERCIARLTMNSPVLCAPHDHTS
jgi:hypothetical protein